jgi:hypothetical protein
MKVKLPEGLLSAVARLGGLGEVVVGRRVGIRFKEVLYALYTSEMGCVAKMWESMGVSMEVYWGVYGRCRRTKAQSRVVVLGNLPGRGPKQRGAAWLSVSVLMRTLAQQLFFSLQASTP